MRVEAIGLAWSSSPENRHAAVNAIDKYLQDQILGVWLACEGQAAREAAQPWHGDGERTLAAADNETLTMAAPKHHK